jgi:diacylglycerol kinase family enzyme
MDVCLLNKKEYFLICLSIGHWSKIIHETKHGLKIHLGFFAYIFAFLKQWKIYRALFKFNLDGQSHQIEGNTMIIANALSIFKLRPRTPVDFSDGQLEILIGRTKTIFGFFILVASFFLGKRRFPYLFKTKGKKIIVEYAAKKEKEIQIDGENVEVDKIEVEIVPQKLTLIANDQNN